MKTCDFVITNPPYTNNIFRPFIDFLINNNLGFVIFGGLCATGLANTCYYWIPKKSNMYMYERPDGSTKACLTFFITSFKPPIKHINNTYDNKDIIPATAVQWYSKDEYHFIFNVRETPHSFPKVMKIRKNVEQGE